MYRRIMVCFDVYFPYLYIYYTRYFINFKELNITPHFKKFRFCGSVSLSDELCNPKYNITFNYDVIPIVIIPIIKINANYSFFFHRGHYYYYYLFIYFFINSILFIYYYFLCVWKFTHRVSDALRIKIGMMGNRQLKFKYNMTYALNTYCIHIYLCFSIPMHIQVLLTKCFTKKLAQYLSNSHKTNARDSLSKLKYKIWILYTNVWIYEYLTISTYLVRIKLLLCTFISTKDTKELKEHDFKPLYTWLPLINSIIR